MIVLYDSKSEARTHKQDAPKQATIPINMTTRSFSNEKVLTPTSKVLLLYGEGVRLCVEDVTVERQRVLLGEYHEQVFETLTHEERFHFIQPPGLDLKAEQECSWHRRPPGFR